MRSVIERPRGANPTDPPSSSIARDAVRWEDPEDIRLWIAALRSVADEGMGAGEDATRPKCERVLSRAEARRRLVRGEKEITILLDAGERGLETPGDLRARGAHQASPADAGSDR
jgi:hypothetical protein